MATSNKDTPGPDSEARLGLTPIGQAATPWRRGDCPKNMREARERGQSGHLAAHLQILPEFQAGLAGLERASHLILLGWFADVDRHVLVQQPAHLARPQGCFALRTPARPNPIGLSIVQPTRLDLAAGRIELDALDWFDGTLLLDIKPYYASTDAHPAAEIAPT
jgi:tRNA (adenine37-N6)-methyltransferase